VDVPRFPAQTVSMYTDPCSSSDRTIMLPESIRNVRTEKLSAGFRVRFNARVRAHPTIAATGIVMLPESIWNARTEKLSASARIRIIYLGTTYPVYRISALSKHSM
jgi:hypothetical protein